MDIDELLLTKEEVPIISDTLFTVPIHPLLLVTRLDPRLTRLDPRLANRVFPQAAEEWYSDLKKYRESEDLEEQIGKWYDGVFLDPIRGNWAFSDGIWGSEVSTDENGFACGLSISRNSGGTIYFNKGSTFERHEEFVSLTKGGSDYIRFSPEKAIEFGFKNMDLENDRGMIVHVYNSHNIDSYPGALFLRNWGILYINEALKSVFDKK